MTRTERKYERVSRMVYLMKNNLNKKTDLPQVPMKMSHLCHNRSCMLTEHLLLEPRRVNQERKHCMKQGVCTKFPDGYPNCILSR